MVSTRLPTFDIRWQRALGSLGLLLLALAAVVPLPLLLQRGLTSLAPEIHMAQDVVPEAMPAAPVAWLSQMKEVVAASEYNVTWQSETYLGDLDQALHAPNRVHGFRTYFSPESVRVIPRLESSPSWE